MAFVLCIPFFAVLSGESIRREDIPSQNDHFVLMVNLLSVVFVVMRACAILGCTRTIGLSVAIAYALYATCFLVVLACLSVRYVVSDYCVIRLKSVDVSKLRQLFHSNI